MGASACIRSKGPAEAMGLVERVQALEPQSWVQILVLDTCVLDKSLNSLAPSSMSTTLG